MTQPYTGTLTELTKTQKYGFIGCDTIRLSDGRRAAFEKDVFVHQADCNAKLKVGQHFRFDVEDDPGHRGKKRATALVYWGSKTEDQVEKVYWLLTLVMFALPLCVFWLLGVRDGRILPLAVGSAFTCQVFSLILLSLYRKMFHLDWDFSLMEFSRKVAKDLLG